MSGLFCAVCTEVMEDTANSHLTLEDTLSALNVEELEARKVAVLEIIAHYLSHIAVHTQPSED